jgi:type IV secretion system protein VirB4
MASMHNFPVGSPRNHWGPPSRAGDHLAGPYYFNFHRAIWATSPSRPSGAARPWCWLPAGQAQKARTVYFDKDRGAEIFLRASAGATTCCVRQPTG